MSVLPPRGDPAAPLVGREPELQQVQGFLDSARNGGSALLVSGEPGVGKTALLRAAVAAATGTDALVLPAAGVEFEVDVPFSTLNQLLLPLLDGSTAERDDALAVALGLRNGVAPERAAVARAALDLLRGAAGQRPVVVVVDDLHWVDRASAVVLGTLARNVAGRRIGFLGAYRSEAHGFFDTTRLPDHRLGPLDPDGATRLLRRHFPAMADPVVHRLLSEAAGNPLALVELPAAMTGEQRTGREPVPSPMPVTGRLRELFAARVRALPGSTRALLLVAALEGSGDLRLLAGALPVRAEAAVLARPAVDAGLAEVDREASRLTFRHPLIRSTVVAVSDLRDRRVAHRGLAEVLAAEPDRRAWHLAEATTGPDEVVAGLLEQTAARTLRRGDAVGAVNALLKAADLSRDPSGRGRRLAEAAYVGADAAGELQRASRLLLDARRTDPQGDRSLRAAAAAAYVLLNGEGDIATAHRLLVGALDIAPVDGPGHAYAPHRAAWLEALRTLLFICLWGQRPELWEGFRTARGRLPDDADPLLDLQARILGDPARAGAADLARLDAEIDRLDGVRDSIRIERVAQAGTFVDRVPACRDALWRVVGNGRDGAAVTVGINALVQLCVDDVSRGSWDQALALADEGLQLCTSHGYELVAWPFRHAQGVVAAGRGEYDKAQALADRMTRWALPRGVGAVRVMAEHIRTVAALGQARFDDAFHAAEAVSPAGTLTPNVAHALWLVTDLVEAAVHSGRRDKARAHVQAAHEGGIARLSPRLSFVVAGAAAMAAPDDRFVELFDAALAVDGLDRWPFDLARLRLAYGERLRRARRTTAAREQLGAALEIFQRLGAEPWVARAGTELRATGSPRAVGTDGHPWLTPQEHHVALLASSGLTNREIGARLSISPRTVAAHLRQVFPKLQVTSRAALRGALARLTGGGRIEVGGRAPG